jgi:4-azaleucine resistance transporter AzlC
MNERVTFTLGGAWAGARQSIPLALSVFAYGTVFGVLARQTGMSLAEATTMSAVVYAGSAQLIALDLWTAPLPMLTIVLTTLIVNLRHVLMGAALRPWFSRLRTRQAYVSAFFLVDESWALTMREFTAGGNDAAFLMGSGLALFAAWLGATFSGYVMGTLAQDPAQLGLDFAFPAVFVALLAGMWRGKSDLWPWVAAVGVSVLAAQWLPGKWYILLGGLAGSLVGAVGHDAD